MSTREEDRDSNASSFDEEDDQDWGDWVEDDEEGAGLRVASSSQYESGKVVYHALFSDPDSRQLQAFDSALKALDHSRKLGFDLLEVIKRCKLDTLQIIRLINHLRRQTEAGSSQSNAKGSTMGPEEASRITGEEDFLSNDDELVPVAGFQNDALLQVDFDELVSLQGDNPAEEGRQQIADLQAQLRASQMALDDLRQRFLKESGISHSLQANYSFPSSDKGKQRENVAGKPSIDEDSHYFTSYASHDIHQVMISDKVRTLSYAKFLLSPHNAHLMRGKTVMDVGCGSGILSLFAARAGAKEVIAIDASDVAARARENIRVNGMDSVVKVYNGKVEELSDELSQYRNKVDVIVSEWMGYFLLYESMLPSVLYARDQYLAPGGLMAPSHTRMLLSAVADCSVISNRLSFWDNVHGFSMPAMKAGLVDEAWTDVFDANQLVTSTDTIYELPLQTMSAKQPSFTAPFSLKTSKSTSIRAFVSWFDTWFTPDGKPTPSAEQAPQGEDMKGGQVLEGLPDVTIKCPEESDVRGLNLEKNSIVDRDTDEGGSRGETVSFTTGPQGLETHWKQTLFVLKEPLAVEAGTLIIGELRCTPNEENKREVDVEIHYYATSEKEMAAAAAAAGGRKSVQTKTVQLFAVR